MAIVTIRTIMINGNLRMVHIYADEQGLHHVYFTEPRAGEQPKFLGERIFKDGQIILDTYRND
jgi:hypothetical protein